MTNLRQPDWEQRLLTASVRIELLVALISLMVTAICWLGKGLEIASIANIALLGLVYDLVRQNRVQRRSVETRLRGSEEKYRSLFESLDEGFCLLEVLFDADGTADNYRCLEVNQAFAAQTGLVDAAGKTTLELLPAFEPQWAEIYGRVAKSGNPVRFEADVVAIGRILDVYAFSSGALADNTVAVLVADITERKRRERNAAFLAELQDDFASQIDAAQMMQIVGAKIGAFLNLSICGFVEVDEAEDRAIVPYAWHREDTIEVTGTYRISEFLHEGFHLEVREGKTIVINDVATDDRTDAASHAAINLYAFVGVPFVRDGQWKFLLNLGDSRPRQWRQDEIELARSLADRVFSRLERARTEAALRHNERMFSALVDNAPFGVYTVDSQFRLRSANTGSQAAFSNIEPLLGRDFAEILHILWEEPFASEAIARFRHTLATGESFISPPIVEQRANIEEIQSYDWQIHRVTLPDGDYGVVCYYYDLTELKRAEEIVRRNGERDAFLVTLGDALRSLTDPIEVQSTASRVLGRYWHTVGQKW